MTNQPQDRPPVLELIRDALRKARARGLDREQLVELVVRAGWPEPDVRSVLEGLVTLGEVEAREVTPDRRIRRRKAETWVRVRLAWKPGELMPRSRFRP